MKNIFYSIGMLVIVLGLSLNSCTKETMNKIQGVWVVIPVSDVHTPYVETWEFTNDGELKITNDNPTYGSWNGKYTIEAGFLDTKLTISDLPNQYNFYNADWKVIQLKRNTLYINNDKDGGLYTKEFERP